MAQHAYSWNGSRIHFVLEESVADAYNRAADKWIWSQKRHREIHGKDWNPTEPLESNLTKEELEVWNNVAEVFKVLVKLNGGGFDIPDEELTTDGFVLIEGS